MIPRRTFLGSVAASLVSPFAFAEDTPRKRLAIVTNVWHYRSHAWHMGERFLHGYPINGKWHQPPFEVVAAYVDQTPKNDLSRERAKEFGFTIYPTVAEALRRGGKTLAVDAVLVIGEHGDYPRNEFGQIQYPRYEYFKQITDVFTKDGRTVPYFNDKHLSWKWERAKDMVETATKMGFGLGAGSSLPVTWRMPSIDLAHGAAVEEILVVGYGGREVYDFHGMEALQCMAERRKGGETGIAAIQTLGAEAVFKAMDAGDWKAGGWDPRLFEACLSRSQALTQAPNLSHRYPAPAQIREWAKDPVAHRIEYVDGTKATLLMLNGVVGDITFAAKLAGESEPLSTLFYLPPTPNTVYSAALMSKAEQTFTTNKAPCPIERTLLTGGLVEAGLQSLADSSKRRETPHLAKVNYQVGKDSLFWRS